MQEFLNIKPNNERPYDTYLQRRYSPCFMSGLETKLPNMHQVESKL